MKQKISLSKTQSLVKISLLALCIVCGFLSLIVAWQYLCTKNSIYNKAQKFAIQTTQKTATEISQKIIDLSTIVNQLANDLSTGKLPLNQIIERLNQKPLNINGLGVAFAPYAYKKTEKLYAPYAITQNDRSKITSLESVTDYSAANYIRYSKTITQGPTLHNPFFDEVTKNMVIEYSAPFYDHNKKVIGIVFGNYTINYLQGFIESLYPSRFGYESIIARDGTYIMHPNYAYVEQKKTVSEVAHEKKDSIYAQNIESAIQGKITFFNYKNLVSGQNSWIFFEPIPSTNWYAAGTFIVEDIVIATKALDIQFIVLVISLIAFIIFLILYVMGIYIATQKKLRIASAILSIGIIFAIATIWYKEWMNTGKDETTVILEKNVNFEKLIQEFYTVKAPTEQNKTEIISEKSQPLPILVYTGLYIHKLSINLDTVTIIGYIWQKYPLADKEKVTPGIVFPQAYKCNMEEAYRVTHGKWETVGWSVRCTLKQNFDFQDYPIDFQKIKIILWPKKFDNEIALVPDLYSYKTLNPTALPGVNRGISLQNWKLDRSYFEFAKESYATNFGYHSSGSYSIIGNPSKIRLPKLIFNIIADRYASSLILLSLLPIIIILTLLFIVLLMARIMKFSHMLASITSLFFTSLIAYSAFKANLPIQKMIFFDYLYFVVQLAILASGIIAILYYKKFNIRFIHYDHLFIPQIFFWPLLTTVILIISLIFFQYY